MTINYTFKYLLNKMLQNELKEIARHYLLALSGKKEGLIDRIGLELDWNLENLISPKGALSIKNWNDFAEHRLGGGRSRSYNGLKIDISFSLLRLHEKEKIKHLWDINFFEDLNVLGVDLTSEIYNFHGNTLLSTALEVLFNSDENLSDNSEQEDYENSTANNSLNGYVVNNRYKLVEFLGKGGFGEVWSIQDLRRKGQFVIKFSNELHGIDSLNRELEKADNLSHPNICKYYHIDEDPRLGLYIIMQFSGISVAQLIADRKIFSVSAAINIVRQCANALDYAHQQGILHLDINPGNILIDQKNITRITDFGISANIKNTKTNQKHTVVTSVIGYHPCYSAPEIILHEKPRRSSDQYSLALVLCSILENELFHNRYNFRQFSRLTTKQNSAIKRALNKEPDNRFNTCMDFVNELI